MRRTELARLRDVFLTAPPVTAPLVVKDLSPFVPPSDDDAVWLARLQDHVRASDHVIRLGSRWMSLTISWSLAIRLVAGRPGATSVSCPSRRRLADRASARNAVIEQWLVPGLNLLAVPHSSPSAPLRELHRAADGGRLVSARRPWLPGTDRRPFDGTTTRPASTSAGGSTCGAPLAFVAAGSPHVASVRDYRDLDNDVSRTLVAAERVLTDHIGHDHWHTPRVDEVLPQLRERSARVRAFRPTRPAPHPLHAHHATVQAGWPSSPGGIAKLRASSPAARRAGRRALLDVAELWELFVLNCVRAPRPIMTSSTARRGLTRASAAQPRPTTHRESGRLKPDVLVRGGRVVAVIDAKYKRSSTPRTDADGVDRADLYQLTSYLARFAPDGKAPGALVYPRIPTSRSNQARRRMIRGAALSATQSALCVSRLIPPMPWPQLSDDGSLSVSPETSVSILPDYLAPICASFLRDSCR